MSAEGGLGGGGRAGIGGSMGGGVGAGAGVRSGGLGGESGIGAVIGFAGIAGETGIGTVNQVGSIPSIRADHSAALNTISGKSGGEYNKNSSISDIFSAPEHTISQDSFSPDTAMPGDYSIFSARQISLPTLETSAEVELANAIDTVIKDAAQELNTEIDAHVEDITQITTIVNEVPVKESLLNLLEETIPLTSEYKHTDTTVRGLENLKSEYEALTVNTETIVVAPEILQETKPVIPEKPKNEPLEKAESAVAKAMVYKKAKAVFKEYAATYILPRIKEITATHEKQPKTATPASSLLKVVDGEFQLVTQEVTEEKQKENLKLTVKDQVELMTDVEQAVKTQELYVAIGYQTDAATALAVQALHQTLERKQLEIKVADHVQNAAETLQKTKDRPVTKTELAPLVDDRARIEVNKKIREAEPPRKMYKIKDKKAEAARIEALDQALNQVATKKKLKQENPYGKPKITGKDVTDIMATSETNRQRSQIVQPTGTDWSLPGDDGVYIEASYLEAAEPDKIRQEIIGIMNRKPPVEITNIQTSQEVTYRDVERVVRKREIKPKVVEIFNAPPNPA